MGSLKAGGREGQPRSSKSRAKVERKRGAKSSLVSIPGKKATDCSGHVSSLATGKELRDEGKGQSKVARTSDPDDLETLPVFVAVGVVASDDMSVRGRGAGRREVGVRQQVEQVDVGLFNSPQQNSGVRAFKEVRHTRCTQAWRECMLWLPRPLLPLLHIFWLQVSRRDIGEAR